MMYFQGVETQALSTRGVEPMCSTCTSASPSLRARTRCPRRLLSAPPRRYHFRARPDARPPPATRKQSNARNNNQFRNLCAHQRLFQLKVIYLLTRNESVKKRAWARAIYIQRFRAAGRGERERSFSCWAHHTGLRPHTHLTARVVVHAVGVQVDSI